MKIYYVVNARMPNEKAYGIQIAKMCEAFIEQGVEIELLIPKTRLSHISLQKFYDLRVSVPTRTFASPDWYDRGSVAFAASSFIFMTSVCFYLLRRKSSSLIYTIDMDPYSYAPLALLGIPIAVEMHSPKSANIFTRFFFKRVEYIITTNSLIRDKLVNVFNLAPERFIVEPNGVDPKVFETVSKEEARLALGLPADARIVLYVGRFYDWKGIQVLQKVSIDLEEKGIAIYLVGGTQEYFETATGGPSAPLRFGGSVPYREIGRWCAAADALLVLGTRANEFSYRYTAPMKLFEYMASDRPVVAADTLALRSLVGEQEVAFYVPDDPVDLARKIFAIFSNQEKSKELAKKGLQKAYEHLWSRRTERIRAFVA